MLRAPAQCSGARDRSMERWYHSVIVNTLVERDHATAFRKVIMHTSRSIMSTSTVRGVGLSTSTLRSDRRWSRTPRLQRVAMLPRSHPRLATRQAGCLIIAVRRKPSGLN